MTTLVLLAILRGRLHCRSFCDQLVSNPPDQEWFRFYRFGLAIELVHYGFRPCRHYFFERSCLQVDLLSVEGM